MAPIRNRINHGDNRGLQRSVDDIDITKENLILTMLNSAIGRFIAAYEAALKAREPGDTPAVIDSSEFRDYIRSSK